MRGGFDFSKGDVAANVGNFVPLEANMADGILQCKFSSYANLKLYPIPFKAARGIGWKGESLSTNVASMNGLKIQLDEVNLELSSRNAWTFNTSAWKDWTPDPYYALSNIGTQYMGLSPAKGNIF